MTTFATTMTFGDLITEVTTLRFTSAQQSQIARWIQAAYGQLWGMADWTFRFSRATLTIAASDNTPTMPSDFGVPQGVWLADGTRLGYLSIGEFHDIYASTTAATGTPSHYTIVGSSLLLGPTPATGTTATMPYEKRPTQLTDTTDVPSIPSEHHYSLVFGALAIGLAVYNDFTSQFVEAQWQKSIESMRRDYLAPTRGESHQQPAYRPGSGGWY